MADESAHADEECGIHREPFVALPIAAAMAFQQAQGARGEPVGSASDNDDALNIAASALSRLLAIYMSDEVTRTRIQVKLDLAGGKFVRGASGFQRRDGSLVSGMAVRRGDLSAALALIERAGISFNLAMIEPVAPAPRRPEKR